MEKDKLKLDEDKKMALFYLKTFADTIREPILILDPDLRVVGGNSVFYNLFLVKKSETENKLVYELGNRQWDIPELRTLLEKVLPEKKFINDFEVTHEFPSIGLKVMLLNARQLDHVNQILLAFEDVTLKRTIEARLAKYTKDIEKGILEKTKELKCRVDELENLNKIMVGRELKMLEMKEELEQLKK
ncbi:PAS domain-containing protein [Patescibacteria group bacterium]|nr:PAS domain-containing protein [Patescibacteria group bacterium]